MTLRTRARRGRKLRRSGALAAVVFAVLSAASSAAQANPMVGYYGYDRASWSLADTETFGTVVVHYPMWLETAKIDADIRELVAAGHPVIIDCQFIVTKDQRKGQAPLQDLSLTVSQGAAMLDRLKDVPLAGISLDEESVPGAERVAYLSALASRLKAQFPERRFLQWFGFVRPDEELSRFDIAAISGDGFIIDPYLMEPAAYERLATALATTGKPVIAVLWASPGWKVGSGRTIPDASWWNDAAWKVFYRRVAFNQTHGIESIMFMASIAHGRSQPLWAGAPCEQKFVADFARITVPYLGTHSVPLAVPDSRPDWIPAFCSP